MEIINNKLDFIKEQLQIENFEIICFKKYLCNYEVNIICCHFENKETLKEYWCQVVDYVAINIQAELSKVIELFNVYIIFFCNGVDEDLIYTIEQDKYSSRKIVINDKMASNIESLKSMIEERIIKFEFEKVESNRMIEKWLKSYDESFYNFLKDTEGKEAENLDAFLEILK
jgi:hypothetical protein